MAWMAWTLPTTLFFAFIGLSLVVLTMMELRWPTSPGRGWLPIVTTRGDRFFISLLAAAWVHLLWLGAVDWHLAWATLISALLAILIMRWG